MTWMSRFVTGTIRTPPVVVSQFRIGSEVPVPVKSRKYVPPRSPWHDPLPRTCHDVCAPFVNRTVPAASHVIGNGLNACAVPDANGATVSASVTATAATPILRMGVRIILLPP